MGHALLAVLLTTAVSCIASFGVYSGFHAYSGLKVPEGVSPARLLFSFLIVKVGMAIAFVLVFHAARQALSGQWLLYQDRAATPNSAQTAASRAPYASKSPAEAS